MPIRRTKAEDWAPLAKAVPSVRAGTPDTVHRRHECGFPRGLRRGADEQLAAKARVGGDLLSRCANAPPRQFVDRYPARSRPGCLFEGGRAAGVTVRIGGEQKEFRARDIIVSLGGIHSPAFLMRAGIGAQRNCANTASRCAPICRAWEKISPTTPSSSSACCRSPARGKRTAIRPHPMTCFRYSSNLPGAPPFDMYINVQCKTSWSALGHRRSPIWRRHC